MATTKHPDATEVRDHLLALLAALDQRLCGSMDARAKLADERFTTEREQTREGFAAVSQRATDQLTYLLALAEERRQAGQRAIDKVDAANEKRFEGLNEFRAQLRDQASTFVTRNELEAKAQGWSERADRNERFTDDRLKVLEGFRSNLDGRFWALGVGLGFLVFVINIAFHFLEMKGR